MDSTCVLRLLASVCVVFVLAAFVPAEGKRLRFQPASESITPQLQARLLRERALTVHYAQAKVDHFNFEKTKPATFSLRYLLGTEYWDAQKTGPMFIYLGNEGDIYMFANNTGFMYELAQKFHAVVVFAEHRFYGTSLPFPAPIVYTHPYIGFLTSEQALADYAELVPEIKRAIGAPSAMPVVAFGGSYGGMLAAWARMLYPATFVGAYASSAPIWQFTGMSDPDAYYDIATADYAKADATCPQTVRQGLEAVQVAPKSDLAKKFSLCAPITDAAGVAALTNFLTEALTYMAVCDYPYATGFLQPLPAWPVAVACQKIGVVMQATHDPLLSLAQSLQVYYNTSGLTRCFNLSDTLSPDLGMTAWDYQACTEMVFPMSSGNRSMFLPGMWDEAAYIKGCEQTQGATPRPAWMEVQYGGKQINSRSNIVFTNGELDPWRSGGVQTTLSDSLVSIVIAGGAHHLDLRSSDPADPASVVNARAQVASIIASWIAAAARTPTSR